MVKQGSFTVELILADTKAPFQEHTGPDGKVYAEVEPDAEYFIRVKNEHPTGVIIVKFKVDGDDLGYQGQMKPGNEDSYGLFSLKDGKETNQALRLQKASVMDCAADADDKPWTGCAEVCFFQGISGHITTQNDGEGKWGGGKVGILLGGEHAKKGVKSGAGSIFEIKEVQKRRKTMAYSKGEVLGTIKLYYCTAVGLIFAGVLPKPPAWDLHRMLYPRKEEENKVKPELIS
jgi:hypothetical protein